MVLKTKKKSSSTTPAFCVKDEKCLFDAYINDIISSQIQAVFDAYFNKAIWADLTTCLMPNWVSYFVPSSMLSLIPSSRPSSQPTLMPSASPSTSLPFAIPLR
jgi:hypothetical protein